MVTKAYHRFKQRCDYYDSDLELCDLLVRSFRATPDSNQMLSTALGSNTTDHPYLGRRRNTQNSRNVVGGHFRKTFYGSFIKDIYEDFEEFVSETMARAAQKGVDPSRFLGDVKPTVDAKTLLGAGSWDSVVRIISNDIFRKLENERSTIKVVKGLTSRLDFDLPDLVIDTAMAYLDARHMLVHQDGKADAEYRQKYPHIAVDSGKISLTRQFATDAKLAVDELAKAIDQQIIAKNLIRPEDMHP